MAGKTTSPATEMTTVAEARGHAARRDVHGILLLDKPLGASSNRALQITKRLFGARKAGHTGSLDPLATGMLPICFGDATRLSQLLLDADKSYQVDAQLGARSATGDREGDLVEHAAVPLLGVDEWQRIADRFIGPISQMPPMYSALKHDGKRLYALARAGEEVERAARPVVIHALDVQTLAAQTLSFHVRCSKGTYVRTLVEDLAKAGETLAWTASLRRTGVVPFEQQPMHSLETLEALSDQPAALDALLLPPDAAIPEWPAVSLSAADARRFCLGQRLPVEGLLNHEYRCYDPTGVFLGTASSESDGVLRPRRVMAAAQGTLIAENSPQKRG